MVDDEWICECPDNKYRHVECKHILAIKFSSKLRATVAVKTISPIQNLTECIYCHSNNIVKSGLRAELEQIGYYPPWYEQFLIGRCGLDTSVAQRYWNSAGDQSLLNRLIEAERCGEQLTMGEAITFLVNEFIKAGKNPTEVWHQFEPRK